MQQTDIRMIPLALPDILCRILPTPLLDAVRFCGAERIEEIRLHANRYCSVSCGTRNIRTGFLADEQMIRKLLLEMCEGSLYAYSQSINNGYLSLSGGIRVGVCGSATVEQNRVIGVHSVTGLMIRIPHRVRVDASPILQLLQLRKKNGGILIYSPPGVGKTTLLRATAALAASAAYNLRTVVVDTRSELKYTLEDKNLCLDILESYPRGAGIEIATRSFGAQLVICDEIGSAEDARSILENANCGIPLIASAHASRLSELLSRPIFRELHEAAIFHTYVGLARDGTRFRYCFTAWEDAKK
ncbi:MAG: hypothetical protein IJW49_08260 [Clostridia bacterium]|nr:hypothetical protein [Clostridia bacterium]